MYIHFINYFELNQDETYLEKPLLFAPTYKSLIHWANGKFGAIADMNNDNVLRFVEYIDVSDNGDDSDGRQFEKIEKSTYPVLASGIIAYWLKEHHGELSTAQIFSSYYDKLEKDYIKQNEKALDGWKRNFKIEFYEKHLQQVQQQFIISENIYPFLKEKDVDEIKKLEANYLEFVKSKIQTNSDNNNKEIKKMEDSVLDKITTSNWCFYYEGWRNGKKGGFVQKQGIYRFHEKVRNKGGNLDDVHDKEEDNPIVAIGIVAYWLIFNSRKDNVIKRLTSYRVEIPKTMKEQFENYTKVRFEQFKNEHRDDPDTWDWDWEYQFYAKAIIPHEIGLNKQSEALFDYISDSDIALVKAVMKNYIKYLKKCRTEKGYQVSPELLVLRAVDSQDDKKYEDLEDYEVNTILDKLEKEGFIMVAWIEGHKPEGTRILDKGRAYLKHLEEGSVAEGTKPVVTPQQPAKENTEEIPSQTQNSSVREITWAERKQCFKSAVLVVMEQKKHDGEYLFEKHTQWKAVYRFAVDIGIMYDVEDPKEPKDKTTPKYAVFETFAKELQLDVNPPIRLPFTKSAINDITKEYYIRYNTPYPWSHEGITDARSLKLYTELDDVYFALQEEYTKLLGQAERSL